MPLKTKTLMKTIEKTYTKPMHTVFLGLGSNIGNKKQNIKNAVTVLKKYISDIQIAKLYETKPMYYEDQDSFINTVIKGKTLLSPEKLLAFIKSAESSLGRQKRFRNGPREIDIDILFYDLLIHESTELVIPHPGISEREFVLQPFSDLDPGFVHPVLQKTIKQLLTTIKTK